MNFLCISAALAGLMATQPALGGELRGRALAAEEPCARVIAVARAPDRARAPPRTTNRGGGHGRDEDFVCESSDGRTRPLKGSDGQMKELRRMLAGGRFVSAESTVAVEPRSSRDDAVRLPQGKILIERASRASRGRPDGGRALAAHEGQKAVLVVRVKDVDGRAQADPANVVSDKVFGTHGDRVNAKSQLAACSFGKFVVTNEYAVDISQHLSAPGVVDVDIPISLVENGPTAIENAVRRALEEKLGFDLPGPFDHVMYVLESCYNSCGWAAYAWINSWLSVYVGDNYKYPAVQLHEIGHNMNLGHSGGIDGSAYTDHSCIMGNPHFDDDIGVLCFNAAKSWQIANEGGSWYNENESDTIVWNSGRASGSQWTGAIVGIADYRNNPNARPVVVKLESGGPIDLFVGFNRKSGINFETKQARDSVTVVEAGNDGLGYSQSFVKAILAQGDSYTAANWRGSGLDMIVHVKEINLRAYPAYADVSMSLGIACGNGVCELGETPANCSTDCSGKELATTFDHDLGGSVGNLFLVKATCDIEITSLYINTLGRGDGEVRVYTRGGSYAGFEQSTGGWTIIYSGLVDQLGAGQSTFLGRFLTNVVVRSGAYQSFYVVAEGGLVDSEGSREFTAFASDNCVQLFEGSSTEMEFGQDATAPRVWSGIIQYDIITHITESPTGSPTFSPTLSCGNQYCDADEDSASCPSDCIDKELETTYDYDSGSNGNMIVVKSRRDVTITSLAINTMAKGEGAVKVFTRKGTYTGHERSASGWQLIYDNAATQMKGRGRPTVLDGMEAVSISGGAYQTFYVWAEKRLVYKRGFIEKMPFASDESLIVFEGIGVKDLFGPVVYSPRVWSGSIRYETSVL